MDLRAALERQFGIKNVALKHNLTKAQLFDEAIIAPAATHRVLRAELIGLPDDTGVRLNGGRVGAA